MGVRRELDRAAAAHRDAEAHLEHARHLLSDNGKDTAGDAERDLAAKLADAAALTAPGWLGQALSRASAVDQPTGDAGDESSLSVRVGHCQVAENATFPALISLLGTGHLFVDAGPSDRRVLSILRATPFRLLVSRPADTLSVAFADCAADGDAFAPFSSLVEAGLASAATDAAGLSGLLDDAEAHLSHAARAARSADVPERLLVVAGIPPNAESAVERLAALAETGPAARLHLVVAGWGRRPAAANATHVAVSAKKVTVSGIPMPVTVDPVPPTPLIHQMCEAMAASRRWLLGDDLA